MLINDVSTGHETTAGLLSYLFVLLIQNPDAYEKLQGEVDQVIGKNPITVDQLKDLVFLKACLWETLRLQPPSGAWIMTCMESDPKVPVILADQWEIISGQSLVIVNPKLHRGQSSFIMILISSWIFLERGCFNMKSPISDPKVWGDDADAFKPERMVGENFTHLPKNCLKVESSQSQHLRIGLMKSVALRKRPTGLHW